MTVKEISDHFFMFKFTYKGSFDNHIYAFINNNNEALIIDTGYKEDMKRLLKYFEEKKIKINRVVLTHYHEDHFEGLKLLKDVQIIASREYTHAINQYYLDDPINDEQYFPDIFTEDIDSVQHGSFELKFFNAPGHSKCSIHIIINNDYIHVSDNIMHSDQGMPHVPLPYYSFTQFIESLVKLKPYSFHKMIASHSDDVFCENITPEVIQVMIKYLETFMKSEKELTLDEMMTEINPNNEIQFDPKWHKRAYELFRELGQ
ncbi:MBL fold metallo-hydrolase [Chengkuizengella axinellae]|uniref:MBL fold metallo-hydrolase n=1 Tax=Chengkuizengella axinellae TaxID=3064388 RepID=A0ABT9J2P4_9BACL|nr:MBL fold metallo-hydrolase [Chengkuizengella sp. 2205SS18-9]MDP5275862.1 MBL fold metallo-hydrolase [Chengkuizengella sp. 2205SS18-9]